MRYKYPRLKLRSFPFEPSRFPFFYGWILLPAGTLGILMSAPGQTVGVSVFTDSLIGSLGISRSLLSLGYLIGTLGSALLLSRAGRVYDRRGARLVATIAAVGLAATLLLLSYSVPITQLLSEAQSFIPASAVAFAVVTIGFFLLRFSGQGVLALCGRNMVMEWFEARRGVANAVMGVAISFGFSYAPRVFEALLSANGWQSAWRIIAASVAAFALFAFVIYRDTPEAHGLKPDGGVAPSARRRHPETTAPRSFTLYEARRTYSFWLFSLSLFLGALLMTAYAFHIVSIFADAGIDRTRAVAVFFPASMVAVFFQFGGSWLSDHIKLKYFGALQAFGAVVMGVGLIFLAPGWPVIVTIAGHGMMQGVFGITSNITWPRFFGREHLGAVSGFAMALTVAGSAVGPYLFSFARDLTGGYQAAALICAVIGVVLSIGAFFAEKPR